MEEMRFNRLAGDVALLAECLTSICEANGGCQHHVKSGTVLHSRTPEVETAGPETEGHHDTLIHKKLEDYKVSGKLW